VTEFVRIEVKLIMFSGLSEGESVEMPMTKYPWGMYFVMFRDKYGIEWTVEYDPLGWL
jgi:PhnB protein